MCFFLSNQYIDLYFMLNIWGFHDVFPCIFHVFHQKTTEHKSHEERCYWRCKFVVLLSGFLPVHGEEMEDLL